MRFNLAIGSNMFLGLTTTQVTRTYRAQGVKVTSKDIKFAVSTAIKSGEWRDPEHGIAMELCVPAKPKAKAETLAVEVAV